MRKQLCLWVLSLLIPIGAFAQVTASGTVISGEDNFPIIGATVICKEKPTVGTATDLDGNFTLEVPAGIKTLVISYTGMKPQEVTPKAGLQITLMPDVEVIEDVVVTGFQKIDRKMFSGSAQKVTAEEAKNQLVDNMKEEARSQAMIQVKDIVDEAKLTATKEAKKVVIQTIQRTAVEAAIENTVSIFHIESDEIKGRVIGREGRNIRALEAATGIEIIVDDTPEAIILSGFDPVRREIPRLALHRLVTDGRIHPARIEEVVAKVQKQLEDEIMETGKRTCIDLGIHGLHVELVRLIGRMKYRSSYGQNLLQHSREVANICATMASELGLNPKIAKRAGLLHDIGKVSDEDPELPHAILGMKLAEKYKEKPEVCNAIGSHHEEVEMTSIISPLVMVGDAISGARPGARREVIESYIKRLKDMENIAQSYPGVTKTYAIQAGRELRVIVGADQVSDQDSEALSTEIARRIQEEMVYPGQVKITVIRETRSVAFAK